MTDYITTYTGIHFYPAKPDKKDININDIAHALSLICRGNGQVRTFFSVAQHCIYCAREAEASGYSNRLILACLLHDASECYMSDVPRPLKKYIDGYNRAESKLLDMIYEKYLGSTLSREEEHRLKFIDDALLYFDLLYLLGEKTGIDAPDIHIDLSYAPRPFEEVENEYLKIFRQYYHTDFNNLSRRT